MKDGLEIELNSEGIDVGIFILLILGLLIFTIGILWLSLISAAILTTIFIGVSKKKKFLRVTSDKFEIITRYPFIERIKSYSIHKMKKVRFEENVKSDAYRSKKRIRIAGEDVTPEIEKEYIRIPEIIRFSYEHERIEVGAGYGKFRGKEIVERILEIQNSYLLGNKTKN